MRTLTVTIEYDDSETTPDYLMHTFGAVEGVTDLTAHAPYNVTFVDTDEAVAVLPNRAAAEETMRSMSGDYYVSPAFTEDDIEYDPHGGAKHGDYEEN